MKLPFSRPKQPSGQINFIHSISQAKKGFCNIFLLPQSQIYCTQILAPKGLAAAKLRLFLTQKIYEHFALEGDFAVEFFLHEGKSTSQKVAREEQNYFVFAVKPEFLNGLDKADFIIPECLSFAKDGDFFVAGEEFLALYKEGEFCDVKHAFGKDAQSFLTRAKDFEANAQTPFYSTFVEEFEPILPSQNAAILLNFAKKTLSRGQILAAIALSLCVICGAFGLTKQLQLASLNRQNLQLQTQLASQKDGNLNLSNFLVRLQERNEALQEALNAQAEQNAALQTKLDEAEKLLLTTPFSRRIFELLKLAKANGVKIAQIEFDNSRTKVVLNAAKQEALAAFLSSFKELKSSKIEQQHGNFISEIILK